MPTSFPRAFLILSLLALPALASCDEGGFAEPEPEAGPTVPGDESSPNEPSVPLGKVPTAIAIVSGGSQVVRTGARSNPLVVRVTDERGIRVEGVTVDWEHVKGPGFLVGTTINSTTAVSSTNNEGEASTVFRTSRSGTSVVEARVKGVVQPARFTIEASSR